MRAFVVADKYDEVEKFWGKPAVGKAEKKVLIFLVIPCKNSIKRPIP